MIYDYNCKTCGISEDVAKMVRELEFPERCPRCGYYMKRMIRGGQLSFGTFRPGFNHALGENFSSKSDLDNALRRVRGETGRELVEVGNTRFKRKAKQTIQVDKDEVIYDFKKELKRCQK